MSAVPRGSAGAGLALSVRHLTRRFGGVVALKDVDIEVLPGGRHAVIGPNGAGKSTLFRVVSGEYAPSEGQVLLGERDISGLVPERVAALGVARSFQTSSLFPEYTVLENVVLAALAHTSARRDLWRPLAAHGAATRKATDTLALMGLADRAGALAGALSHGEQRQLELAMVLAQDPRLLLLDEPLAGLSTVEREHVMALIQALPAHLTLLLIEHDLPFCLAFADRITVLSNGEHLATGTPDEIRANPQVQAVYVGSALERQVRPARKEAAGQEAIPQEAVLSVRGLASGYGGTLAVEQVSLEVRPGEVVAVLGRNGMGKSTLLNTLMGWKQPLAGEIVLGGQQIGGLDPARLSKLGLALVPQGRRMLAELTVDEELRLALRPGQWTLARVYETFPRLRERQRSYTVNLSGGEQQMVAIGRALLQNPRVLLLDEPTEGLSPLMVTVVRDVLLGLRENGETMLLAEQNLDLALAVADRVYVLDHGQVVFSGEAGHLAENRVLVQELMGV